MQQLPVKFIDLIDEYDNLLPEYANLAVQFTKKIEDCETYPENGMQAKILAAEVHHAGEVIAIMFDFQAFRSHNQALEDNNYYDKNGIPCLTATEAGCYEPQGKVYFEANGLISEFFNLI